MTSDIQFETPENVCVSYRAAGAGTRFVAWFVDMILVWLVIFVMAIVATILGTSLDITARDWLGDGRPEHVGRAMLYVLGIIWFLFSLGSLFYFGASELLSRGQTLGKRGPTFASSKPMGSRSIRWRFSCAPCSGLSIICRRSGSSPCLRRRRSGSVTWWPEPWSSSTSRRLWGECGNNCRRGGCPTAGFSSTPRSSSEPVRKMSKRWKKNPSSAGERFPRRIASRCSRGR